MGILPCSCNGHGAHLDWNRSLAWFLWSVDRIVGNAYSGFHLIDLLQYKKLSKAFLKAIKCFLSFPTITSEEASGGLDRSLPDCRFDFGEVLKYCTSKFRFYRSSPKVMLTVGFWQPPTCCHWCQFPCLNWNIRRS